MRKTGRPLVASQCLLGPAVIVAAAVAAVGIHQELGCRRRTGRHNSGYIPLVAHSLDCIEGTLAAGHTVDIHRSPGHRADHTVAGHILHTAGIVDQVETKLRQAGRRSRRVGKFGVRSD